MLFVDSAEGTLGRYAVVIYQLGKYAAIRKSSHAIEPDIDTGLCKFGYPHPSSSLSKGCPVASGAIIQDSAARVADLTVVAVRGCRSTGLGHVQGLGAPSGGVERHMVASNKIDPLEDVDLATCDGRIRTQSLCCDNVLRQYATELQHHGSRMLPICCVEREYFF